MIDNNNQNLNAIVDVLDDEYEIRNQSVIPQVVGDLEIYVNEYGLTSFQAIPAVEFIYAFASNLKAANDPMDALRILWEHCDVEMDGYISGDAGKNFASSIDWDQAVDDWGRAIYNLYFFQMDVAPEGAYDQEIENLTFSAAEVEAFARTW